jgi:hypothetical protein
MTLEAVKEAIAGLPADERNALAAWLTAQENDEWDAQMEKDFSRGGRGVALPDKEKAEVWAGKFKPMDDKRSPKR